jgi:two-component system sensor histidine kinase/response regulator
MLRTVLRNLISNAIKFTNIGGKIHIYATLKQEHVEISIADNGIGINKEKSKMLFEIISNTTTVGTANENGSGLGLVLCKEFVNKNGGEIWVESEEGKASDFKFTLPLHPSE